MVWFLEKEYDEGSEFVIHEKNGKLKAYYYKDEIITRYISLVNYFRSKHNKRINERYKNVKVLYKPRYIINND